MKTTRIFAQPITPPVTGYTLELTPQEMNDLQQLASGASWATFDNSSLPKSVSVIDGAPVRTHNRSKLLEDILAIQR